MSAAINIIGAACTIPSGPTLPLADCALRTQLALLRRHSSYVDRCGFPVRANCFADSGLGFGVARWCALAASVLEELANGLGTKRGEQHSQLWLVLPRAGRAGVPSDLPDRLIERLKHPSFRWERIKTVRGGHAVGAHAVRQAAKAVLAEGTTAVVVAADSWLHPEALQSLERDRLLHGAHFTHEGKAVANPYGRIPGEGAAAIALAPQAARPSHWAAGWRRPAHKPAQPGTVPWAQLSAVALGEEPRTFDQSAPCTAQGLVRAATEALTAAGAGAIHRVTSDLTSEPYRADELGFTTLRLAAALAPGWKRATPVTVSGDLGAASAIAHLSLAAYGMRARPTAQAERHLILSSADDTLRAAMVVDSLPRTKPT